MEEIAEYIFKQGYTFDGFLHSELGSQRAASLNNVIKEHYAPEHKKKITNTADDTLFRKNAKAGSVSALVPGAELGG